MRALIVAALLLSGCKERHYLGEYRDEVQREWVERCADQFRQNLWLRHGLLVDGECWPIEDGPSCVVTARFADTKRQTRWLCVGERR